MRPPSEFGVTEAIVLVAVSAALVMLKERSAVTIPFTTTRTFHAPGLCAGAKPATGRRLIRQGRGAAGKTP